MKSRLFAMAIFASILSLGGMMPAGQGVANQPPKKAGDKTLTAFDALPHDALLFVSFRFQDIWRHEFGQRINKSNILEFTEFQNPAESFTKDFGINPDMIDRMTLTMNPRYGPMTVVSSIKKFDPKEAHKNLRKEFIAEQYNGETFYSLGEYNARYYVNGLHCVSGSSAGVKNYIDAAKRKQKNALISHITGPDTKRTLFSAVNIAEMMKQANNQAPPGLEFLQPVLQANVATFSIDVGKKVNARAEAFYDLADDAKAAHLLRDKSLNLVVTYLNRGIAAQEKYAGKEQKNIYQLLRSLVADLRKAKIEQKGKKLIATAEANVDWKLAERAVDEYIAFVRKRSEWQRRTQPLRMLGIGIHTICDSNRGTFPRAAIVDKNGKPLLSWRVMILPYIDEQELYKQFRLDEPWDSPHNYKLLSKMPKIYEPITQKSRKSYKTNYQAVVGKGTIFDPLQETKLQSIADGTANTIMLVEAKKAVHWTKPEDVEYVPGQTMSKLGGLFKGGFHALLCDGSVHFIRDDIGEKTLDLLLQRNDGMVIPQNVFDR